MACWVFLGDGLGDPVVEEFIRYPKSAIFEMGTRFHGLLFDDIKNSTALSRTREECIKYIAATDILITCNAAADLRAIGFTSRDMRAVAKKVRDVGMFFSPRRNHQPMALRHIVFLYFGIIIQDNGRVHSPATDATFAIWLYLYRMDAIERQIREKKNIECCWRVYASGFSEIIYDANKETSRLYREYFKEHRDWPTALRNVDYFGSIRYPEPWSALEFVDPDEPDVPMKGESIEIEEEFEFMA